MKDVFSTGRYEHNRPYRHIFYLPNSIYAKLSSSKPVYLFGGRGSGKTSLLKILDWKERLNNKTLSGCFGGEPFSDKILGIYLKLPQQQISTFDRWLSGYQDDQAASIFGLYLDLLWIEDAVLGMVDLEASGVIELSSENELFVLNILRQDDDFRFLGIESVYTKIQFASKIRAAREQLKQLALLRKDLQAFSLMFPILEPGELGRKFASIAFDGTAVTALEGWTLKVCFDEAEVLSEQQQICLNSATRHTKAPLGYVFAFVSTARDLTTTIYNNLTVNLADCEPVYLDSVGRAEFCRLVEGVAEARVKALLSDQTISLKLSSIFGDVSPNELLRIQLNDSVSRPARDFLAYSESLKNEDFFTEKHVLTSDEAELESEEIDIDLFKNEIPFYQSYLILKGVASMPRPGSINWVRRAQESAELRKRMIAAYLSACKEFSMDPIYAGWRAAASIADNSVRDMLFQLDQIFIQREYNLRLMCSSPLAPRLQDKALREASNLKLRALPEWVRIPHEKVRKLVETLGCLTQILQSTSSDNRHLRSSERGIFLVDRIQYNSNRFEQNRRVIEEALYGGYLVESKANQDQIGIRLHRSLAPYFQFSYRGPYYGTVIALADFDQMTDVATNQSPMQLAVGIASRFDEQQTELQLFNL